ncbi:hypothetical protein SARC_12330, partial [Sphaeroforma arctica JP610]
MIRIITHYAQMLSLPNAKRRAPEQWVPSVEQTRSDEDVSPLKQGVDLKWFVYEMLNLVGCLEDDARHACMHLTSALCPHILGTNAPALGSKYLDQKAPVTGAREALRVFLRERCSANGGNEWLVAVFERGLRALDSSIDVEVDHSLSLSNALLAALDCYHWVLSLDAMDPEALLETDFGSQLVPWLNKYFDSVGKQ